MGKRFTATEKWDDPWYRKLPCKYRDFWQYVLDKCDNSGVWIKDIETASYFIGETLNEQEALSCFNNGKERIVVLKGGLRWLVADFVSFQFGVLRANNPLHRSILTLQEKNKNKGYLRGSNAPQEKDMVKEKDKEKDKEGVWGGFPEIWSRYPNKDGRKEALRHFKTSVKTEKDWMDINKALDNYLASEKVLKGYIKNGSTWFNNWRDWIDYKPEGRILTQAQKYGVQTMKELEEELNVKS